MWFNIDFSNVFSVDKNTVTSTRTYVGPHIFTDGALEYSSFEGGYIDPAKGVMYSSPTGRATKADVNIVLDYRSIFIQTSLTAGSGYYINVKAKPLAAALPSAAYHNILTANPNGKIYRK